MGISDLNGTIVGMVGIYAYLASPLLAKLQPQTDSVSLVSAAVLYTPD